MVVLTGWGAAKPGSLVMIGAWAALAAVRRPPGASASNNARCGARGSTELANGKDITGVSLPARRAKPGIKCAPVRGPGWLFTPDCG
jgi:hypothetical protein